VRALLFPLMLMACFGSERAEDPYFTQRAQLTPPWTTYGLPLEEAVVTFSDGETFTAHHRGQTVPQITESYRASLIAQGWTPSSDTSTATVTSQIFTQDSQRLSLSVMIQGDTPVASVALLPF